MRSSFRAQARLATTGLIVAGGLLSTGVVRASDVRFSDFTPLSSSAGPAGDEAAPITFGNPAINQRSVIDRATQLAKGAPNTGNFDMTTVNETGPHKGE